jgi:excisionase family DNA binding protein
VLADPALRTAPPPDRWLTADEAVAYLGLPSRKALYQAVRRGQLPVHRLGKRRMRFSRAELDRALVGANVGTGE